jgi:hypothetical protein
LVVGEGAELIIKDETLRFNSTDSKKLYLATKYGSTLNITNSTITSVDDSYWVWRSESTLTYGYPVVWNDSLAIDNKGNSRWPEDSCAHASFESIYIENSIINNTAHMFFDSPLNLVILSSSIINLHPDDIGNYTADPANSEFKLRRMFFKGNKSFFIATKNLDVINLTVENVTIQSQSPINITLLINRERDNISFFDLNAEGINILVNRTVEMASFWFSTWPIYYDSGIGLVNTKFNNLYVDSPNVDVEVKYYLDVLVKWSNGTVIEGATVNVTNEVNDINYPSQNINKSRGYGDSRYFEDGQKRYYWAYWFPLNHHSKLTSTITGSDGHTPLPSNKTHTLIIADYAKNYTGQTNFTYTITVSKDGYTASITGVDPDETWYREDPNVPTITVECDLSSGNCVIVGVKTGSISGTVTDTNGTAISGATVTDGTRVNTTNSTGGYILPNVPVGSYTVTVSKTGYTPASQAVTVTENQTTIVDFQLTPDTTFSNIFFRPPTPDNGSIVDFNHVYINVTLSEAASWIALEWNNNNESMQGSGTNWYKNKTNLANGTYSFKVWANDSAGNMNVSETRVVTVAYSPPVDTTLPTIIIQNPKNDIYTTKTISLNYSADEALGACYVSVDGTANATLQNCENQSVLSREYENTAGVMGWWHFNEGSGSSTSDSSGNGNGGTLNGSTWVNGKFGKALSFDGSDDYVEVNDSLNITNQITLEAWVKTPITGRHTIFEKWLYDAGVDERSFELDIDSDRRINFGLSSNGSYGVWLKSSGTVSSNTWTHIAATSDSTTMKIFINGEQDPNTADSPSGIHQSTTDLHIGRWWTEGAWHYPFNGIIDEVRILNRALTADEIKADYALGLGSHSVTVYANDTAGNWNSTTVYFTIDTTPPTSKILSPSNGTWVNGIVTLIASASDLETGVKNVQFQYCDPSNFTCYNIGSADTSEPYKANWNTSPLPDISTWYVRAVPTDNAGNTNWTVANYTMKIDHAIPIINNQDTIYPDNQYAVRNGQNVTLRVNVTDGNGSGILNVSINASSIGGSPSLMTLIAGGNGSYETGTFEKNITVNATDGTNLLTITSYDKAIPLPNIATGINFIVEVDNTPPIISDVVITFHSVTISWTTNEDSTSLVEYGTQSGSYTSTKYDSSYNISHSITLTDLSPNTTYYFAVSSTDKAGNSIQSEEYNFTTPSDGTSSGTTSSSDGGGGGGGAPKSCITGGFQSLGPVLMKCVITELNLKYKLFYSVEKTLAPILPLTGDILGGYPAPTNTEVQGILANPMGSLDGDVYQLSAERVSKRWTFSNTVIVARGDLEVDSMAALAFAKSNKAPILLTHPTEIPNSTLSALKKLNPKRIIIVGGPIAVSKEAEAELEKIAQVERIWGENREETAVELAKHTDTTKAIDTIVIADGRDPSVDAVFIASGYRAPIVYVGEKLPKVTRDFLEQHKRTSDAYRRPMKVVFVGVSEEVQEEIEGLMK